MGIHPRGSARREEAAPGRSARRGRPAHHRADRGRVRVTATSWIGVVRLRDVELRVVPKYAGGDLGVLRMLDYASGLPALRTFDSLRTLQTRAVALSTFSAGSWPIRQHGSSVPACLRTMSPRGPAPGASWPAQGDGPSPSPVWADRDARMRLQEHETDVLENQVLAGAVALARRVCSDPEVVSGRLLLPVLDEACDRPCSTRPLHVRLDYNRRNEHYRPAHEIAWLFLAARRSTTCSRGPHRLVCVPARHEPAIRGLCHPPAPRRPGTRWNPGARPTPRPFDRRERADAPAVRRDHPRHPARPSQPGGRIRLPVDAKYKLYDVRRSIPQTCIRPSSTPTPTTGQRR